MRRLLAIVMLVVFTNAGQAQTPEVDAHTPRIRVIDSVSVTGQRIVRPFGADSAQLVAEIRQMMRDDQKFRGRRRQFGDNGAAQRAIDSANTLRMIGIIRTYGFPSNQRFSQAEGLVMPHIILVHAPEIFFDTLRPLLDGEKAAGRMSANEYAQVRWHLDGRRAHPELEGGTTQYRRGGKKMIYRSRRVRGNKSGQF